MLKRWGLVPYSPMHKGKHKAIAYSYFLASSIFFQGNPSAQKTVAPSARKSASTLDNLVVHVSAAKAEFSWALKVVDSSISVRSCLNLSNLFQVMFPDSTIAKNF